MSICPRSILVVAAAALLSLGAASPARALVLDWDTAAWTPGDLVNSYDLNGDAVNDITIQITSQQQNIWTNDPISGLQAPVDNQTLTGGLPLAENTLMLAANLDTRRACTVQITFSGGNGALNTPGAANVSFTLFDIDITTDADVISSIYGVAVDGTLGAPTSAGLNGSWFSRCAGRRHRAQFRMGGGNNLERFVDVCFGVEPAA